MTTLQTNTAFRTFDLALQSMERNLHRAASKNMRKRPLLGAYVVVKPGTNRLLEPVIFCRYEAACRCAKRRNGTVTNRSWLEAHHKEILVPRADSLGIDWDGRGRQTQ